MKQSVYTVRDDVAETFCLPYVCMNDGVAVRAFYHGCKDPGSMISKSPGDYALYVIGVFDDDTGVIVPEVPRMLVRGSVMEQGE